MADLTTLDGLRAQFPAATSAPYFLNYRRGPLPLAAHAAGVKWLDVQMARGALPMPDYAAVADDCRAALGALLGAPGEQVALMPNTGTAISTVAQGLRWREGDEVVISDREYPANVYPWMNLADRGVAVRIAPSEGERVTTDAIRAALSPRTRLVALSAVYFSSGFRLDLPAVAQLCRDWGALLLVDVAQAVATQPLDLAQAGADFLVGDARKFICGPDGVGFLAASADMLQRLQPPVVGATSVENAWPLLDYDFTLRGDSRRFEPGGRPTAALAATTEAARLWVAAGMRIVQARIDDTVEQLISAARNAAGLTLPDFAPRERSAIVIAWADPTSIPLRRARADAAVPPVRVDFQPDGRIVFAPHAFTSPSDVEAAIAAVMQ